jgi:hypothetical protein
MAGQPEDSCDWVLRDFDFRFGGPGIYGDHFYNQFYLDDQCRFHKDGGPAFKNMEGDAVWFRHGLRHRDGDEPAFTSKEGKVWYKDGKIHRDGKPAAEYADGRAEWWLEGIKLTDDEAKAYKEKLPREEWRAAADEIVAEIRGGLKYDIRAMKPPKFLL